MNKDHIIIYNFFSGRITVEEYNKYITANYYQTEPEGLYGDTLEVSETTITIANLVKVCNAILDEQLDITSLFAIGRILENGSSYYFYANSTSDRRKLIRVAQDWGRFIWKDIENNLENVRLWKEYLLTGNYNIKWKKSYEERKQEYEEYLEYSTIPTYKKRMFEDYFTY